jgi:hypothetical protein
MLIKPMALWETPPVMLKKDLCSEEEERCINKGLQINKRSWNAMYFQFCIELLL